MQYNIAVNINKVVIQFLLGYIGLVQLVGLAINPPFDLFADCTFAKNYENWLTLYKVIAVNKRIKFF